MYTATMRYHFKSENFKKGCEIWKDTVLKQAKGRKGLIRMQWLEAEPNALAIGTWNDQAEAQEFMQTGVFKQLMEKLDAMLVKKPEPEIWTLTAYHQE